MHKVFRFDDQSLRKNEWNCRLVTKGVRLFFGVFREEGPMASSQATQLRFDCVEQKRLTPFRAYEPLKHLWLDGKLSIHDAEFWHRSLPGIVGVNTVPFPLDSEERARYCRRLAQDCDNARADLLFCDLGTGLATPNLITRHPTGVRRCICIGTNCGPCSMNAGPRFRFTSIRAGKAGHR